MSGRIRSVKPEWLEDELLALASDAARVLTIGLMLQADDYGNGRANPILLAGQVFPGKIIEHTANALEELRSIRFVELYEVDGQRYFHIRNWNKHQRVDKPGKPRVPAMSAQVPVITDGAVTPRLTLESAEKYPENPANIPASRGSDRGRDPGPDLGPGPEQPRDIRALAERALKDRHGSELCAGDCVTWPEVKAVVAAFEAAYGRPDEPRHGGDSRARVILERLAEGYVPSALVLAVMRSKNARYMALKSNQSLNSILKDGARVEKFSALMVPEDTGPPRRARGGPPQADHGMTGWETEEQRQ